MPIQVNPGLFPSVTPDQANPLLWGAKQGQGMVNQGLAALLASLQAREAQAKLPYAGPQAAATVGLTQAQTGLAQGQTSAIPSEINLRNQQAGLAGSVANLHRFQVANPAFINPEASALTGTGLGSSGANMSSGGNPLPQVGNGSGGMQTAANGSPDYQKAMGTPGGQPTMQNGGADQKPDYNYGVTTPTINYSSNPIANQLLLHKYGADPKTQQDLDIAAQQKKQNVDNYNNDVLDAHGLADSSFKANQNVDQFMNAYKDAGVLQTGTIGGHQIPFTSAANKMENAAANLVAANASNWQKGHITNADISLQQQVKLARTFNPEAVSDLGNGIKAYNNRAMEYEQFINEAASQKLPNRTAHLLWDRYNQLRPAFNSKDNIVNSNYQGTWQDFLTPQAVANPSKYIPANQGDVSGKTITLADIKHTAQTHNQSVSAVKQALREKGLV